MKPDLKKDYLDENDFVKEKYLTSDGKLHRRALRHSLGSRLGRKQTRKKAGVMSATSVLRHLIKQLLRHMHLKNEQVIDLALGIK